MKSAQEWLKERCVPEEQSEPLQQMWSAWIAAVQTDALQDGYRRGLIRAAGICREDNGLSILAARKIEAEAQRMITASA